MVDSLISQLNWSHDESVKNGTTKSIPLDGNRLIATSHGSNTNYRGLYTLVDGVVFPIIPSSYLTITYANGTLNIQNTASGGSASVLIL